MSQPLARVFLVRHGETEWSLGGRHTGRTDIPLTTRGEQNALLLGRRLQGETFTRVYASPLARARQTCELAGLGAAAVVVPEAMEWDYGAYEGRRSAEIHQGRPGWSLFRDGCPGGEDADQVGARADRLIEQLRQETGNLVLFSHGHFLRVLAARWLGLAPQQGRLFVLGTAAVCILGYEHARPDEPALALWNDTQHLQGQGV